MFIFRAKKRLNELEIALKAAHLMIERLEKQVEATQAIVINMVEGVVALDNLGNVVSINPAVEKIFGVKKIEAEGRFFLDAIRNNDMWEVINIVLNDKKTLSSEMKVTWPVQKIFQVNATPIFEKGAVNGCLIVIHDITEIRKLETMRRDFVANVSHELKTPLTSIKGFVETLLEGALEDKENSRLFLKIIQDHANRLNNLINDLLDLSHIESKEIKLDLKSFNLKELTEEILLNSKSQAKKKSLDLSNDLPADLSVMADRSKIEQVLTNLIDNAIKFNKEKGVVKIYSRPLNSSVKIFVEDSGAGIPEKDLARVFERFYRVDKARSRELGGTGLGLSIVKHIVELHGGSLGVESTEGQGSKFWFTLPKG